MEFSCKYATFSRDFLNKCAIFPRDFCFKLIIFVPIKKIRLMILSVFISTAADNGLNCARNLYTAVKESTDGYIFSKSIRGRGLSVKKRVGS